MPRAFVSGDWGTTNFRLRWIENGAVRGTIRTDEGTAKLAAAGGDRAETFRAVLARGRENLGAPRDLPVVISGMAGSSIGWKELPYARLPFPLDGSGAVWEEIQPGVRLLSGLRSDADVMRGEETEAIGAAALLGAEMPDRATLLLPGTHSKHLEIRGQNVVAFRSFMTGEVFDVLARHSVLRHSVRAGEPIDRESLAEGVRERRRAPLTAALFRVRTRQVLDGKDGVSNASFLSGLLIASELEALDEAPILLCAGEPLRTAFVTAAEAMGLGARLRALDSEPLAPLGQALILDRIQSQNQPFVL